MQIFVVVVVVVFKILLKLGDNASRTQGYAELSLKAQARDIALSAFQAGSQYSFLFPSGLFVEEFK